MIKNICIGPVTLSTSPRTVAIIDQQLPLVRLHALKQMGVDIIEVRVDCLELDESALCSYIHTIKKETALPIIGTIRENDRTRPIRLRLFEQITPLVDAIDIEIDAAIAGAVINQARGKTIIVSEHDYTQTPDLAGLNAITERAGRLGAHIIKIATTAHSFTDTLRLMIFTQRSGHHIVSMTMGPHGSISRIIAPMYGSLFSYGYTGKANASGQLSVEELIEEFRRYYPGYADGRSVLTNNIK